MSPSLTYIEIQRTLPDTRTIVVLSRKADEFLKKDRVKNVDKN